MVAREEAYEVCLVPVVRVGVLPVVVPFLEIAFPADAIWQETGEDRVDFCDKFLVGPEDGGCAADIGCAFADDGEVGGGSVGQAAVESVIGDEAVLRRGGRTGDQVPVAVVCQYI